MNNQKFELIKSEEQSTSVEISNEDDSLREYQRLGKLAKKAENSLKSSLKCSVEHAREIGRIASEVQECIKLLPTKAQQAKLSKTPLAKLDYKKPTFEDWIETYTGMGKDTVYKMVQLYEELKDYPKDKLPEDMSWREALGYLSNKQKSLKSAAVDETETDDEPYDDGDDELFDDGEESHNGRKSNDDVKNLSERKAFNAFYEKIDNMFAKFLKKSENSELKEIVGRWKNLISSEASATRFPHDKINSRL